HSGLIMNIKSEGIEFKVLNILEKHNIKDYFFLDCSFPACIKLIKEKNKNFAVRLSEWESLETCLKLKGKAGWVWIDTFTKIPITHKESKLLKEAGYKLCLVSPDLTGMPEK